MFRIARHVLKPAFNVGTHQRKK